MQKYIMVKVTEEYRNEVRKNGAQTRNEHQRVFKMADR